MSEQIRNRRKLLIGVVSSKSGEKTVKVTYAYKVQHKLYSKEVNKKTVVHVHDENSECDVGDRVQIMETRPISKLKRWRITKVLSKAPVA
jgi:small subunit ribosomal protein S17